MPLSSKDVRPEGITLTEAYQKIYDWYRSNKGQIEGEDDDYSKNSCALIDNLPPPEDASELEIRAIMREVISGLLEWAYHQSDGNFKMAAYAHEAVTTYGGYMLNDEEIEELKNTRLWPHLMHKG